MLKHEPETPCRASVYGEGIYLEHWQRFMATTPEYGDGLPDERFAEVFEPRLPLDTASAEKDERARAQRAATVAASFIVWLGTNCGRAFISEGQRATAEGGYKPRQDGLGFLLAWAVTNRRVAGVNSFRRTAHAIVKEPDDFDLEVMEVAAEWLGTPEGRKLVADAEQEINLTQLSLREQNQMIARAQARAADLKERGIVAF